MPYLGRQPADLGAQLSQPLLRREAPGELANERLALSDLADLERA